MKGAQTEQVGGPVNRATYRNTPSGSHEPTTRPQVPALSDAAMAVPNWQTYFGD
jgi:hypothetical protein